MPDPNLLTSCVSFFFPFFFSPNSLWSPDRLSHQARISASVNAMRILNTGTEVEVAVADALVRQKTGFVFYVIGNLFSRVTRLGSQNIYYSDFQPYVYV